MRSSWAVLLFASAVAFTGCHFTVYINPITRLQSADPEERREAADEIRGRNGPPPQAIPYLFDALARERDPNAYGAILIALGSSGVPQVKPIIDARLRDSTGEVQAAAQVASRLWLARNHHAGVHIVIYPRQRKKRTEPEPLPPPPPPRPVPQPPSPQPPPLVPQPPSSSQPQPQPQAVPESAPQADACHQFATICAADPFDEPRCQRELASFQPQELEAWATCVNASNEPCQKAYDACTPKPALR